MHDRGLLIQHEHIYIYIVDKLETRAFDKNKSRRKRPRGVLGPFTVIFTRRVQPAESRSQPFPLSRKSSRPSGVFALFSTTNHGWLLISKLGEENSRKLLSRIVFSFFFSINKTEGTFTPVTRVALESYFSRVDTVNKLSKDIFRLSMRSSM